MHFRVLLNLCFIWFCYLTEIPLFCNSSYDVSSPLLSCSEVERCIGMLEDSVNTLLNCLETVDAKLLNGKSYFTWELQEAIKCASFLQRIYEEV